MGVWNWTREKISPADILDASGTIDPVCGTYLTNDLTKRWMVAKTYLRWAKAALARGGEDGWDTASSLAKRAVCRQMDGILANNHLGCFHRSTYETKSGFLASLRIPALSLLRDLILGPRNDIEHAYEAATEQQSRWACEIAELFLRGTEDAASIPAIMALGWNVGILRSMSSKPGEEHDTINFELTELQKPMLYIHGYPDNPEAIVFIPKEELLRFCPLQDFEPKSVLALNARLRECLKTEGYAFDCLSVSDRFAKELRSQLNF